MLQVTIKQYKVKRKDKTMNNTIKNWQTYYEIVYKLDDKVLGRHQKVITDGLEAKRTFKKLNYFDLPYYEASVEGYGRKETAELWLRTIVFTQGYEATRHDILLDTRSMAYEDEDA